MHAFKNAPGFVIKMDTDVLVVPSKLRAALDDMDPKDEDLYAGRPNASCECTGGRPCKYDRAVRFCSGWLFVTTGAALASSRRNAMRPLVNETAGGHTECRSSDMMVGSIMGVRCTPLGLPGAPSGRSWQMQPPELHKGSEVRHALCNEAGVHGGFSNPTKQARPDFFKRGDEECMAFHPVKAVIDRKYVAAAILRQPEPIPPCAIFIGVLSEASNYAGHQAVRLTWGWLARQIGMCVHFFVEKVDGLPHVLEPDVVDVHSSVVGGGAFAKRIAIWRHGAASGASAVVMCDVNTYVRPHALHRLIASISWDDDVWAGHVLNQRRPADCHDCPVSLPFCTGQLSIMSATLASKLSQAKHQSHPVGDAGIGMVVARVAPRTRILHTLPLDGPCSIDTIYDVANTSLGRDLDAARHGDRNPFYLFELLKDDQDGNFCRALAKNKIKPA